MDASNADIDLGKLDDYLGNARHNSLQVDSSIINTYAGVFLRMSIHFQVLYIRRKFLRQKFYNLGGRYAIETWSMTLGRNRVDEITGATLMRFDDQSLHLEDDIAATFDQVTGIDDVSGVVFRLYNAAFARLPDAEGLENWIAGNGTGDMTYAASAEEFTASQEFENRYGEDTSDTKYIETLYNNVLERDPDYAGLTHHESLLGSGKTRGELLLDFSESPENVLFSEVTGLF